MARISDEMIDYVAILAQLQLSAEEKEAAKKDMGEMLGFVDKLNEVNTDGVEPMSHIFSGTGNVFREDIVENGDNLDAVLANAPAVRENMFVVPKTVE